MGNPGVNPELLPQPYGERDGCKPITKEPPRQELSRSAVYFLIYENLRVNR
jgi:hypothetical protein